MNTLDMYTTLKKYDFTEYESKIYLALLQHHPLNGNEIAMKSGVPSPKVYANLKRLTEKEIVFPISNGSQTVKKLYSPLPYSELLERLQEEFNKDTVLLAAYFNELSQNFDPNWSELYHLAGYTPAIETLKNGIQAAQKTIMLCCWSDELEQLMPELAEAYARGVYIVSIVFDEFPIEPDWLTFQHRQGPNANRKHRGELSCVFDEAEVVIMQSIEDNPHAIVSSHQALVRTTINYIRHDIYINRVVNDFYTPLEAKYGKDLKNLLEDF